MAPLLSGQTSKIWSPFLGFPPPPDQWWGLPLELIANLLIFCQKWWWTWPQLGPTVPEKPSGRKALLTLCRSKECPDKEVPGQTSTCPQRIIGVKTDLLEVYHNIQRLSVETDMIVTADKKSKGCSFAFNWTDSLEIAGGVPLVLVVKFWGSS